MVMTEKAQPAPQGAGPKERFMAAAMGQMPPTPGRMGPERFLAKSGTDPGQAFGSKFTVHAGTVGRTQNGPEDQRTHEGLLAAWQPGPLAVYLHLPFCRNRCLYCGFAGQNPEEGLVDAYVAAMVAEIGHLGSILPPRPGPVRTIYFGGGTPTILEPGQLARLTGALQKTFDLANDIEMTLEGRVSDLTPEKIPGFLGAGFNRFSLGVQSFSTQIRRSLGRHSDGPRAASLLAGLTRLQKAAVIIDLIYGLPGQDVPLFLRDLETACQVGVDGLDTYQLNTFPGGGLDKAVQDGRLPAPAPLAEQAAFYLEAAGYLAGRKWRRLSLSHYARDTRERNLYNPWAKSRRDCLAVGAGAGGFISGHASYRLPDVQAYLDGARKGLFAPDYLTLPTGDESLSSLIVGQMELGFLDLRALSEQEGADPGPIAFLARNWREAGLVELKGDFLELTEAGRFWGVNLTQALVVTASESREGRAPKTGAA
jgi:oxygen-independent coproporphyrinogen-3 oxidase